MSMRAIIMRKIYNSCGCRGPTGHFSNCEFKSIGNIYADPILLISNRVFNRHCFHCENPIDIDTSCSRIHVSLYGNRFKKSLMPRRYHGVHDPKYGRHFLRILTSNNLFYSQALFS